MKTVDTSLFLDIADALGISSPAIVEKDYWATQLLKKISELTPKGYQLVLSGGTCLAKAHQNTFRMSEDIDIQMIPHPETAALANNQQGNLDEIFISSFSILLKTQIYSNWLLLRKNEVKESISNF